MNTINWTTGNGQKVEIEISTEYEKTSGQHEVSVVTSLDGEIVSRFAPKPDSSHPVAVAKISGSTSILMSQENLDRYNTAMTEVENSISGENAKMQAHMDDLSAVSAEAKKITQAD